MPDYILTLSDWIFVCGSAMLSISIALNALSLHGACTAVFVVVAAIIGFIFASIQTLGRISWLAWVGVVCIITAIFTVTIAVGVQDRPSLAPKEGHWKSDYHLVGNPSFTEAIAACSALVFSYAGTPGFFSIAAEMRDPRHYTKALVICQSVVTITYIVIGVVVYYYCGSFVASPALGSAGPLLKRIGYGLALPGLSVSLILLLHVSNPFPETLKAEKLIQSSAPRQVSLHPNPPRLQASLFQQRHPLGHLVELHRRLRYRRLPHCQWHPRLRWPRLFDRCPSRNAPLIPALRLHVALRQLECWQGQPHHALALDGRLVCLRYRLWYFLDDRWNLWLDRWNHRFVQGVWRCSLLVVRR